MASPQSGLHWPGEFECARWASSAAQERQGPPFRVSEGQGQGQGSVSVEAREARFERGKLLSAGLQPGQIKPWPAARSSTTAACAHSCRQSCVDTDVRQHASICPTERNNVASRANQHTSGRLVAHQSLSNHPAASQELAFPDMCSRSVAAHISHCTG